MSKQTGPACGNNPNHKLTAGDRQAVDSFRAYLAARAALRDRIAAALRTTRRTGYEGQADHGTHRYDARCALCAGDVDALTEALAAAVLPAPADRAALVRACASFVRDTYSGEWADDAAATLETDADKIERGEPCSLLRLATVLPATTDQTAALAATLREVLDTFSPMHDVYGGPVSYYDGSADIEPKQYERWRAVLDGALRRVADETPATETTRTPCSVPECDADGTGEPCTRHEREDAHAEGDHELCGPDCPEQPAAEAEEDDFGDCGRARCGDCDTHYCIGPCQCGTRAHTCDCACAEYRDGLPAGPRQDGAQS